MTRWLDGKKRSLATLLKGATAVRLGQGTLTVILENGTSFARATLDDAENRQLVQAAAATAFGRPLKVEYRFEASAAAHPVEPEMVSQADAPVPSRIGLPAESGPEPPDQAQRADREALRAHPLVQRAVELFGGHVVSVSDERAV
jgi:hypothetical protein